MRDRISSIVEAQYINFFKSNFKSNVCVRKCLAVMSTAAAGINVNILQLEIILGVGGDQPE